MFVQFLVGPMPSGPNAKVFIEAPTAGHGATCKTCAHCPWMAITGLARVAQVLKTGTDGKGWDEGFSA